MTWHLNNNLKPLKTCAEFIEVRLISIYRLHNPRLKPWAMEKAFGVMV